MMPGSERIWELELQPTLNELHGVMVQSKPDFLLRSDDDRIKPVAIFTDGFEFHCHPNNRLADDMWKRRAILESGNYRLWSVTWNDLFFRNIDSEYLTWSASSRWSRSWRSSPAPPGGTAGSYPMCGGS